MMSEASFHAFLNYGMLVLAGITIVPLLSGVTAPYGRFSSQHGGNFGPLIPAWLAWLVMESPASLMMATNLYWALGEGSPALGSVANVVLMCMFFLHYINRAFIYPFRTKGGKPMPVGVAACAFGFCLFNGYLQGGNILRFGRVFDSTWLFDLRFLLGISMFLAGWYLNIQADNILASLRKPGETGYKIPYGGLYDYTSSANYTAEILEWAGWAIATWSLAGFGFLLYTCTNLIPRAIDNHAWYLSKFKDDYPKDRKIIIPFLY